MQFPAAAMAFRMEGKPIACQEFGHGHINNTYKLDTDAGISYVLQKINQYVFRQPVLLMENACAVTEYLRSKDSDPRHALRFLEAQDGKFYHIDENGDFWRMHQYVDGLSLDAPDTEADFYQSALAFGRFQMLLADFPAETLHETIPEFHNTIDRYRLLRESMAADPQDRLKDVKPELDFLMEHEDLACTLQRMRQEGKLPLRVTHNDTKLNNVLLDPDTRKHLCVLDLDTVMPGLSLFDFGDSIRFGATTAKAEDDQSLGLDLHLFEVYTQGFLSSATNMSEAEVDMLPLSAAVMTIELATRFLKDYLDGDLYFKTAYEHHNLDRTRAQITLATDMIQKLPEMEKIVSRIRKDR